jgi:predicted phosphodiesterase
MKLIILGDIHGHWDGANATVHSALNEHPDAKAVVSLGDLGDGWPIRGGFNRWKPDFDLPIYVVDGNHENFDAIEAGNINPKLRRTEVEPIAREGQDLERGACQGHGGNRLSPR